MNRKIRNLLYEKDVLGVDVNSNQLVKIHLSILKKKNYLILHLKHSIKICQKFVINIFLLMVWR